MKLYLSTISALSGFQLGYGLATGFWPHVDNLMSKAHSLRTSGLQLSILKGWKAEQIKFHLKSIPVIEGVWGESFIDKRLLDNCIW